MARGHDEHVREAGEGPSAGRGPKASVFDGSGTGLKHRASPSAFGWQDDADHAGTAEHTLPGLHNEERLPWLSAEDDAERGLDTGRIWAVALTSFALLILIGGGLLWAAHRRDANAQVADGSLILAPPGPIKVAPIDPGGKTFDGTGDSSFTVSQGHVPGATLADDGNQADGGPAADIAPSAPAAGAAPSPGGIGVQVGAFSSQPAAEAAWAHLAKSYGDLSSSAHRIVAATADIGTVYGLQAVAPNDAAAIALCSRLKTAGLNCQVKD